MCMEGENNPFPQSLSPNTKTPHNCYTALLEPTGQIYTDQTGKFAVPSSTGNNYLLILYNYDSNSIWAEPLKAQAAKDIVTAYNTLHTMLCCTGLHPQLQCLDNKCPGTLKEFIADQHIDYELVPP
jgi:hypothetical protein